MLRQVVSGILGGVVSKGIRNIAGSMKNSIGRGIDGSSMGNLNAKGMGSTQSLQYPLNVEGDPMQGHYIHFKINEMTYPKITRAESTTMEAIKSKLANEILGQNKGFLFSPRGNATKIAQAGLSTTTSPKDAPNLTGAKAHSIYGEAVKASKRCPVFISLYMPPNVSVSYTPNFSDVNVGGFAGALIEGVDIIEKMLSTKDKVPSGQLGKNLEDMLKSAAIKSIDAIAPGARALSQVQSGRIISNKMELSFEGVSRRDFTYTFIFIPKSEKEAKVVEQIIYMFKYYSLPEYHDSKFGGKALSSEALGRSMTIPDTFEIAYMYQGKENHFLNKISTCFCTNVSVQYGGDRYVAYNPTENIRGQSGNPPQRTTLTLAFKEMELMTKSRIDEGF